MGKKCPPQTVALGVDGKAKQSKVARVELRAGGGLHGPEKLGWSAGGMEKWPGNVKTTTQKQQ